MRKLGGLVLALLSCVLPVREAGAGTASPLFDSFVMSAVGSITGATQNASLSTGFQVPTFGGPIGLNISFAGPGAPGLLTFNDVGNDPDLCDGVGMALCQLTIPVAFGPNLGVVPGVTLTAFGTLVNGSTVSTQSSFVAVAAPEPAILVLFGAGLLGAAFLRRRARA